MEKLVISKIQLFISIIFFGGNSIFFIYYLQELLFSLNHLKYLTNLSYYANSIFLLLCLLCDILLYIKNTSEEEEINYHLIDDKNELSYANATWVEKLNNWNRNKYGVICNTFSFFVSISFWILFFMGEDYIKVSNTFYGFLSTINLHLIISILVIIDIFISKREHKFSWDYFRIISLLFLIYCFITGINKYFFNINPYAFMNGSVIFLILYVFVSLIILYACYIFYLCLINYKENKINVIKDE